MIKSVDVFEPRKRNIFKGNSDFKKVTYTVGENGVDFIQINYDFLSIRIVFIDQTTKAYFHVPFVTHEAPFALPNEPVEDKEETTENETPVIDGSNDPEVLEAIANGEIKEEAAFAEFVENIMKEKTAPKKKLVKRVKKLATKKRVIKK